MARLNYAPQVFGGQVTLFWASGDLRGSFDLVEGWRMLAGGGMDVHEISGNHLNIIKEPYVGELATKLRMGREPRREARTKNRRNAPSFFTPKQKIDGRRPKKEKREVGRGRTDKKDFFSFHHSYYKKRWGPPRGGVQV